MASQNGGISKIATLISNSLGDGVAGTSTAAIDFTLTDLVTPVAETVLPVISNVSGSSVTINYVIPSTLGNSNALTEWGIRFDDDVLLSRSLTAAINKTSDLQVGRITTLEVSRK